MVAGDGARTWRAAHDRAVQSGDGAADAGRAGVLRGVPGDAIAEGAARGVRSGTGPGSEAELLLAEEQVEYSTWKYGVDLSEVHGEDDWAQMEERVFLALEAFLGRRRPGRYPGAITSRTGFFLSTFTEWREEILLQESEPVVMVDLGFGVLDAMVETAAYVLRAG